MKHCWILFFIICGIITIFIVKGAYSVLIDTYDSNNHSYWGIFDYGSGSQEERARTPAEIQGIIQRALTEGNAELCRDIGNNFETLCTLGAIQSKSIKNGDVMGCKSISNTGSRLECLGMIQKKIALTQKDPTLCQSIKADTVRSYCRESVETILFQEQIQKNPGNTIGCEVFSINVQISCKKRNEMIKTQQISLDESADCMELTSSGSRETCNNTHHYKKAVKEGSIGTCQRIADSFMKQSCLTRLK